MKLQALGIVCLMLLTSAFRIDNKLNSWTLVKNKDNISSFSGRPGKNGITPTKVEMAVHASPEKVVHVIADMDNYKLWVPYCKTSFFLQRGDTVLYGYQRMSAPLVKDRDVALRCTIHKTGDKAYEILIEAVPNFVKTVDHALRIQYLITQYRIYQDPSGTTRIIQVNEVDIGSSLPAFLLNWLTKYQPYETCESLRKVMES